MGGWMKAFIESIMHNDRVWNSVRVDGIEKEQFTYSDTADYFVHECGFVMFRMVTPSTYEIHVCMLKCKETQKFVEHCIKEMKNRGACKFIAPIGDWNKSALKLSKACGFIEEGRIKKAYIRDNKFHAMVMMGSK